MSDLKKTALLLFLLLGVAGVQAQQTLPVPTEIDRAYAAGTRSATGKPGAAYWQNTADYVIDVDFNPVTRLLAGTVEITYFNHSPDQLDTLWFKLYPNLYKKGVARKAKVNERDLGEGVKLSSIAVDGRKLAAGSWIEAGTNMKVPIAPLAPGKKIKVVLDYSYTLNKGSHIRTGQVDNGSHFVAYFFPRIAVYDDVDGWNRFPYTGDEEFYNDFCSFKASITMPKDYQVWATGDLTNAKDIYQEHIYKRLRQAETKDGVVDVFTEDDLKQKRITKGKQFNTWNFEAKGVTDFVFASSDHYIWKSSSLVVDSLTKRRTRVDAVFNPSHKDYYEVVDFARKTVEAMSFKFPKWPFPYSHETIFDGLDQMEYPMMVNDNPVAKREDAITLTVHEIFHTMFPFYMGTNETKYAWMDEGWATIGEWLISPMIDTTMVDLYGVAQTAATSGTTHDSPIMTPTTALKGSGSFTSSYPKPGMGYLFVKDYLGDELFTKALHHYIEQWQGKHPTPFDFFNSMNEGAGKNMNWFWKAWFFEEGITDLAIDEVRKSESGYVVSVRNKSKKPLPVDLRMDYADGSVSHLHHSIGIWEQGNQVVSIEVPTGKVLKKVVLGGGHVPDKESKDNTYVVK